MDAPIHISGLRKAYGSRAAVDAIDLDIHDGEVFALLGPNGAGKTTTVEILEGFRERDAGEVTVLGEDPQTAGLRWRDRLGIVLQSSTGLDLVTPREALATTAKVYSRARDVDEVIAAVGLSDKADDRIGRLSGGQRRRVDVGRGIVGSPELLFLDEPTTGFDPQARRDFWQLIRSLAGGGTTILLTTHYLDEAAQLSDRVAVIAHGSLVDIGAVDEIGGASARVPIVRWRDAAGALREERTQTPAAVVTRLAAEAGGELRDLEVVRPSLEDIYLGLVREADERAGSARGSAPGTAGDDPATGAPEAAA